MFGDALTLCDQLNERLIGSVSERQFVKDIRIATRQIRNNEVVIPQAREHLRRNHARLRNVVGSDGLVVSGLLKHGLHDVLQQLVRELPLRAAGIADPRHEETGLSHKPLQRMLNQQRTMQRK